MHLNLRVTNTIIVLFLINFSGCREETEDIDYVARVNNSYLTRDELASLVDTAFTSEARKNEIITKWIYRELLYQQAEKEGISKSKDFKQTISQSEKELAGAFLLNSLFQNESFNIKPAEIKAYYDKNPGEFRLPFETFILNIAEFIDEDKAIQFRNIAIENDWTKALKQFNSDQSIINQKSAQLYLAYELNPAPLARVVHLLYPLEISIVISTKPGYYSVVQLIEKLPAGTVPAFEYVKQEASERVTAIKRQEVINEYILELYSSGKIEIINQE